MHHANEPIDALEQTGRKRIPGHAAHLLLEYLECIGSDSLGDNEVSKVPVDNSEMILYLGHHLAHEPNQLKIRKVVHFLNDVCEELMGCIVERLSSWVITMEIVRCREGEAVG
jgi:hypothetical protein